MTSEQHRTVVEYYQAIWDQVLVPICGARADEQARFSIVADHCTDSYPPRQWRFQGMFGFGGKLFTRDNLQCSVSYYPEDQTPERDAAQAKANAKLEQLWTEFFSHVGA